VIRLFKRWRLARLEVKLAGAEAALANEYRMVKASGEFYPMVISRSVRDVAELTARQKQLKETAK
jgi:hypothetical protein